MAIVMQGGFTPAENYEIENFPKNRKLTRIEAVLWVRYCNFKGKELTINSVAARLKWRWHDVKLLFEEKPDLSNNLSKSCRTSVEKLSESLSGKAEAKQRLTGESANKPSKSCRKVVEQTVEKLSNDITASVVKSAPYPPSQKQIQIQIQKQIGSTVLSTSTEPHSTSNLIANSELPPTEIFKRGRREISPECWLSDAEELDLMKQLGPTMDGYFVRFKLWIGQRRQKGADVTNALANCCSILLKWQQEDRLKAVSKPVEFVDPEKLKLIEEVYENKRKREEEKKLFQEERARKTKEWVREQNRRSSERADALRRAAI